MVRRGLKLRFGVLIGAIYLAVGGLSWFAAGYATATISRRMAGNFAKGEALLQRATLLSSVQGDLAVSLALSRSSLLHRWAEREEDPELRRLALAELETYRQSFKSGTCFFVVAASGNYWYLDGKGVPAAPRYRLDPAQPNDAWYYATMRDVDRYALNVDYDNKLDVTKVWMNVIVRDGPRRLGLGGSGIDVSQFLDEVVKGDIPGVTSVVVSPDGAIEAHPDRRYVARNSRVRGDQVKLRIYDLLDTAADRDALRAAVAAVTTGGHEAETLRLGVDGQLHAAAVSFLPELGWLNLVMVDEESAVSRPSFLPFTVIMITSLFVLMVATGILLNRIVLDPLAALSRSSRLVAAGDYDVSLPVHGQDEIGELTRSFNDMTRTVKDYTNTLEQKVRDRTTELDGSNRALSQSNQRLTESIAYARLIQRSVLPDDATLRRVLCDPFVLYRPRDVVGGDFYWCRETADGAVLAVGDCTGHGVPGAFMTMTVSATLGHVLDTVGPADPARVLAELDRRLRVEMHVLDAERGFDHGLDIGLCWLPHAGDHLVFAGAGHDLWVVSQRTVSHVPGDRQSVGYASGEGSCDRSTHRVPLEPGALYVLTTDGLLDQAGGTRGHGLGKRRLEAVLLYVADLPPSDREGALSDAVAEWQGGLPQRDDITVLGFGPFIARRE